MPVPANHVGDDDATSRLQTALHLREQVFEVQYVMQSLVRYDDIIFVRGLPRVEIRLNEVEAIFDLRLPGGCLSAFQRSAADVETIDDHISLTTEVPGQPNLQAAIARSDADTSCSVSGLTLLFEILPEHAVGTVESERREHRADVAGRPIVEDLG